MHKNMATIALVPCTDPRMPRLIYKAKKIIAEGECDCDCKECPGVFICRDPDLPPYTMLREFIDRNEKTVLADYKLNNQVNKDNLNATNLLDDL